jgi:hypothetical protein
MRKEIPAEALQMLNIPGLRPDKVWSETISESLCKGVFDGPSVEMQQER